MRRDRVTIWLDILDAVHNIGEHGAPSRVQSRANLPHNRFWRHVDELTQRGLLEAEPLRTTSQGEEFLSANAALRRLLDDPGLPAEAAHPLVDGASDLRDPTHG